MLLIQSSSTPQPTGFPIFHPYHSSSLSTWSPNVYNQQQLDSSSGFCQTVPFQTQLQARQRPGHGADSLGNQTATSSEIRVTEPAIPHPLSDHTYHHHSITNMAEYAQEQVGRSFVHFSSQPYVTGPPTSQNSVNVNHSSAYSPPLSSQPLSHARNLAIPSSGHQPVPIQVALSNDMNGYQPPAMTEMHFRHSDSFEAQSMLMVGDEMADDRAMYTSINRGYPVRYDLQDGRGPLSPVQLSTWPIDEQRTMNPGLGMPPTPLMERSVMTVEQSAWESQEPARASTRAAVANMTESERLERRREQNRLSQAKLRKSRDEQYETVCNEKKRLEASYDRLRAMYNHAAAELAYFHEKELLRCNQKRLQKGMEPYATFEQLVYCEKDVTAHFQERRELQRKDDDIRMEKELADAQMEAAPGSAGTENSATSVPGSTTNGGRSEDNPFAYNIGTNQAGPGQAGPTQAGPSQAGPSQVCASQAPAAQVASHVTPKKTAAKTRRNSKVSPIKIKPSKKRPTSQRSEDLATSELTSSMYALPMPMPDQYQELQSPMDGSIHPAHLSQMPGAEDPGSYFALGAPSSSGHYTR